MSHYEEQRGDEAVVQFRHDPTYQIPINKYERELRSGEVLDVYDVLDAFGVTNSAIAHAVKKLLCTGTRGHKDFQEDLQEAIDSLHRAKSFPPL